MKLLYYAGHPAQFLFFKPIGELLLKKGHQVLLVYKHKDVLSHLIEGSTFESINIQDYERRSSKFSILKALIKRELKLTKIVNTFKPDIMVGTDAILTHVGLRFHIPVITTLEDDYNVIKRLAQLSYPYTKTILVPEVCDVGRWEKKKIGYAGYMKLSYLHPNVFKINPAVVNMYGFAKSYAIIRLAKLTAHHDVGEKGIRLAFMQKIIETLEQKGFQVLISSEVVLSNEFAKYNLKIDPSEMQQVLASASMLISDSQSMSVEASLLGVPSVRVSTFSGKISVLEELEHKYELTFGFKPEKEEDILLKINSIIENGKSVFALRRQKMLKDKIDVSKFVSWFIEDYPASIKVMKDNPQYQMRFK